MNKVTRRELAAAMAVSLAAVKAAAQQAPGAGRDWNREALESHRKNSAALLSFSLPPFIEPAFQFKA